MPVKLNQKDLSLCENRKIRKTQRITFRYTTYAYCIAGRKLGKTLQGPKPTGSNL